MTACWPPSFGTYAARLVADDHFGVTVAMVNNHVTANPLVDIAGKTRGVPDDCDMLNVVPLHGHQPGLSFVTGVVVPSLKRRNFKIINYR